MKVTIDIDCTPEEARRFFGLPDVSRVNDAMVDAIQERMTENLHKLDGDTLLKEWMSSGTQAWQNMQTAFWSQMQQATSGATGTKKDKDKGE